MLAEGQQLGHYRLLRLLKSGGMGEVYLAVDTLLERQVAIKVIHAGTLRYAGTEAAKDAARLFLREAQAIARLDQTNILPLYDSDEQIVEGISLMYMVMPYRQEGSLADWKRAHFGNQLLPLAAVERIVEQAALALQHAHDRQIIHQDVKPSNFLVQGNAAYPSELHLQLADFGVAKVMMITSESQVIRGTPTYMAPEQWEGHPVPATDQYALAAMAYELLTGQPPFVGNGYQQMWHQHVHVAPCPPTKINPTLPQELDAILLRALEKNPERRYSSVSAFAHAFQRAVLNSGNVHQTLTITTLEAHTGTNRVLPLPNGRQLIVAIPAGVNHGQIIRLEGYGRPTTYNNSVGAILVTINIAPVVATETASPTTPTFQHTLPAANSFAQNEVKPTLPPVPFKKRRVKNKPPTRVLVVTIAFMLVIISGSMGFYMVTKNGVPPQSKASANSIPYPSYLPGKGTLAMNDPLKDESNGYSWSPPKFPYCSFQGGTLHVKVVGNDTQPAYFRPCVARTQNFTDFAYQVKMRFVNGDCGGITFRSKDPDYDPRMYIFYICQNSYYALKRYSQNVSGPGVNPILKEGYSHFIKVGSSQVNIIAVVAQGPNIDLYVNLQQIVHVRDDSFNSDYNSGLIGVLARTFDLSRSAEAAFSDAMVWKL
jgi:eukaryotic-like serine/threonine-protein kinase